MEINKYFILVCTRGLGKFWTLHHLHLCFFVGRFQHLCQLHNLSEWMLVSHCPIRVNKYSAFSLIALGAMLICLHDMKGKGKDNMVIMVGPSCCAILSMHMICRMSGKLFIFSIKMWKILCSDPLNLNWVWIEWVHQILDRKFLVFKVRFFIFGEYFKVKFTMIFSMQKLNLKPFTLTNLKYLETVVINILKLALLYEYDTIKV